MDPVPEQHSSQSPRSQRSRSKSRSLTPEAMSTTGDPVNTFNRRPSEKRLPTEQLDAGFGKWRIVSLVEDCIRQFERKWQGVDAENVKPFKYLPNNIIDQLASWELWPGDGAAQLWPFGLDDIQWGSFDFDDYEGPCQKEPLFKVLYDLTNWLQDEVGSDIGKRPKKTKKTRNLPGDAEYWTIKQLVKLGSDNHDIPRRYLTKKQKNRELYRRSSQSTSTTRTSDMNSEDDRQHRIREMAEAAEKYAKSKPAKYKKEKQMMIKLSAKMVEIDAHKKAKNAVSKDQLEEADKYSKRKKALAERGDGGSHPEISTKYYDRQEELAKKNENKKQADSDDDAEGEPDEDIVETIEGSEMDIDEDDKNSDGGPDNESDKNSDGGPDDESDNDPDDNDDKPARVKVKAQPPQKKEKPPAELKHTVTRDYSNVKLTVKGGCRDACKCWELKSTGQIKEVRRRIKEFQDECIAKGITPPDTNEPDPNHSDPPSEHNNDDDGGKDDGDDDGDGDGGGNGGGEAKSRSKGPGKAEGKSKSKAADDAKSTAVVKMTPAEKAAHDNERHNISWETWDKAQLIAELDANLETLKNNNIKYLKTNTWRDLDQLQRVYGRLLAVTGRGKMPPATPEPEDLPKPSASKSRQILEERGEYTREELKKMPAPELKTNMAAWQAKEKKRKRKIKEAKDKAKGEAVDKGKGKAVVDTGKGKTVVDNGKGKGKAIEPTPSPSPKRTSRSSWEAEQIAASERVARNLAGRRTSGGSDRRSTRSSVQAEEQAAILADIQQRAGTHPDAPDDDEDVIVTSTRGSRGNISPSYTGAGQPIGRGTAQEVGQPSGTRPHERKRQRSDDDDGGKAKRQRRESTPKSDRMSM